MRNQQFDKQCAFVGCQDAAAVIVGNPTLRHCQEPRYQRVRELVRGKFRERIAKLLWGYNYFCHFLYLSNFK